MGNNYKEILKGNKNRLTKQQYRTFQGQIKSGNGEGMIKGLNKILRGN